MSKWDELKRLAEDCVHATSGYAKDAALFEFKGAVYPDELLALIAENERLERKNSNQVETIRQYQSHFGGGDSILMITAERDQLRAEVEALRKDADRYRWLIRNAEEIYFIGAKGFGVNLHLDPHYIGEDKVIADANDAIDAAMSKSEKGND